MIIGQHKLLRNIDRFLNDRWSFLCILSFSFPVFNLHNLSGWSLLRINLHRHWFVLLLLDAIFLAHWTNLGRPLLRPVGSVGVGRSGVLLLDPGQQDCLLA